MQSLRLLLLVQGAAAVAVNVAALTLSFNGLRASVFPNGSTLTTALFCTFFKPKPPSTDSFERTSPATAVLCHILL
jgi:hypothetical protein